VSHLDPDAVALLALGEAPTTDAERAHLVGCPRCADEVAQQAAVVNAARESGPGDLTPPPPRVWDRIAAELDLGGAGDGASEPVAPSSATVARPARRRPSRRAALLLTAAVLVGAAAGSAVTYAATRSQAPAQVLAQAQLRPLAAPQASGTAQVRGAAGGQRELVVDVSGLQASPGTFFEVWLLAPDGHRLVSLGVLGAGRTGTFQIPASLDLTAYPVVDISLQPLDGSPEHSGDSLVRGILRA
jgi:Anti-sigma-K factor rskA